jgi:hypothetical protein
MIPYKPAFVRKMTKRGENSKQLLPIRPELVQIKSDDNIAVVSITPLGFPVVPEV